MLKEVLLVGVGSFIGGAARYQVSLLMPPAGNSFPWATFTVNIIGSLIIGMLWGWTSRCANVSPGLTLFLITGFCGGFTTFSTFSKESLMLWQSGSFLPFFIYAFGSLVLGILMVAAGFILTK